MKKKFCLLLSLVLLVGTVSTPATAANESNIKVFLNDTELQFDVPPQIINGRTMVPMRYIFSALGATVYWDEDKQTISARKDDTKIEMTIDKLVMKKNGEEVTLDIAPKIINGRTLVPVRAVAEGLGVDVYWRGEINTVSIHEKNKYILCTSLFNPDGVSTEVEKSLAYLYKLHGWSENIGDVKITMYAADGRTIKVLKGEIEAQQSVGWYLYLVCTMYAPDGRTLVISKSDVEAYKKVGWFDNEDDAKVTMYAPDGRTIKVYNYEIEAQQSVGWYTYPVCTMYAPDGRTLVISTSDIEAYKNVGWFEEPLNSEQDIEKYLTKKYSHLNTSIGDTEFSFSVMQNDNAKVPCDYSIWVIYDYDFFDDVQFSLDYSQDQKKAAEQELKDFQETIARDLITRLPNKKLDGEYMYYWYKYPTIKEGLVFSRHCEWSNYTYNAFDSSTSEAYYSSYITEFHWLPVTDGDF